QVPAHTKDSPFMRDQLELTKMVLESYKGEAFSLATIHGITASAIHPIEARYGYVPVREMLCEHLRANEKPVLAAMDRIADAMCELVVESASLGIDGIYYASLGGERHFFTDEEFARWIEPFDLRIMKTAREAGLYNFLHICKENLNVQRYANYGELADVVNWGVFETHFSLEEGRKLFPNATIMGGLANRSGVLVEGSLEEIAAAAKKVVAEFGSTGFILGADCTLPTEIALERVKAAVDGVK
ncbi:MAG: uroporphyrinogen III decarboxylase, partial [Firmicutes bacterium]|nr:uroporphyrinogen III decarboxylase [Bacillota bacterium]